MTRSLAATGATLLLCVAFGLPCGGQQPAPTDPTGTLLAEILAVDGDPRHRASEVWDASVRQHGSIEPTLQFLQELTQPNVARQNRTRRLQARLQRHRGDLEAALISLEAIRGTETIADCLSKAELNDALGWNNESLEGYERLLTYEIDDELRSRVLLRHALLEPPSPKADGTQKKSGLARFALQLEDTSLRNQAAVILALTDQQHDAIDVYTLTATGTARFREEVRLAQWALEAKLWPRAQQFSWSAVASAQLKRDRRYALTRL